MRPLFGVSLLLFHSYTSHATLVSFFFPKITVTIGANESVLCFLFLIPVYVGQGFPDWATPDFAKEALIAVFNFSAYKPASVQYSNRYF
jgi:hypothetical protein